MQAVIIAGGKGTRLQPLTFGSPKPMLPILDRPFLSWMVERCQQAGITDILMNIRYQAEQIQDYFGDGEAFGVKIRYVIEETALDTAGAMKLAEPYYTGDSLIVFNADILTDLDLGALIEAHKKTQAKATITLTRVEDPTAFGLVELSDEGSVVAFREKPTAEEAAQLGIDTVNAGTYILEPDIFAQYPNNQPLSFERTVFPDLLTQQQRVTGFIWDGYWMDLGTPAKYVQGQIDMLTGKMPYALSEFATEQSPNVWVANSATVDPDVNLTGPCLICDRTRLGPNTVIPANTVVGAHSLIDCTLSAGFYAPGTLAI
ncbi:MAG: NDP-sugar synthase [Cyanobacteria bacterium P01_A01_bin.17]